MRKPLCVSGTGGTAAGAAAGDARLRSCTPPRASRGRLGFTGAQRRGVPGSGSGTAAAAPARLLRPSLPLTPARRGWTRPRTFASHRAEASPGRGPRRFLGLSRAVLLSFFPLFSPTSGGCRRPPHPAHGRGWKPPPPPETFPPSAGKFRTGAGRTPPGPRGRASRPPPTPTETRVYPPPVAHLRRRRARAAVSRAPRSPPLLLPLSPPPLRPRSPAPLRPFPRRPRS